MSIKADPSASRLAVIRRPKEYCDESTEARNGKEKGLIDSVEQMTLQRKRRACGRQSPKLGDRGEPPLALCGWPGD